MATAQDCPRLFARLTNTTKAKFLNFSKSSEHLFETKHGQKILHDLGFKDFQSFVSYLNTKDRVPSLIRRQLLQRLSLIDAEIARYRGILVKKGLADHGSDIASELSQKEKMLSELLAYKFLEIDKDGIAKLASNRSFEEVRKAKLFKTISKPTIDENFLVQSLVRTSSPSVRLTNSMQRFQRSIRECLRNQTPAETAINKRAVTEAMKQTGVSVGVTWGTGLWVAHAEEREIHAKELTLNLLMTAVSNGLGTFLLNGNGSLLTRFVQGVSFDESLQLANTVAYGLTPSEPGKENAPLEKYYALNAGFGFLVHTVGLPMNEMLAGLACLHPSSKLVAFTNYATRTAYSVGLNALFFYVEDKYYFPEKNI